MEATQNRGVDAILDLVGAAYFEKNIRSLSTLGRLAVVGLMSGAKTEFDLRSLMAKRLTIVGTVLRNRTAKEKIALTSEFQRTILPLFQRKILKPVVDSVFDFKEAAKAHAYMESNANFGKVVLKIC